MHPFDEMRFFPNDQVRNYECGKCGFMATAGFMQKITKSDIKRITEDRNIIRESYNKKEQVAEPAVEVKPKIKQHKNTVTLEKFVGSDKE